MKKGTKIAIGIIAGVFILAAIVPKGKTESAERSSGNSAPVENSTAQSIGIGQTLHTDYFDVVVNKANVEDQVNTGNQFADLKKEEGTKYLVIDASFRNTDNETRMMTDGEVYLIHDGQKLKYENAETVMLEGWGVLLENINPGITKRTKLVYKIPADIKGTLLYHPSRSDEDNVITLGEL